MMAARVGRDKDSFNCGGLHGMAQYRVPLSINGMGCNFCGKLIPAGSLALGCRYVSHSLCYCCRSFVAVGHECR